MRKLRKTGTAAGMAILLAAGGLSLSVQNVEAASKDPVLSPERSDKPPVSINDEEKGTPLSGIVIWNEGAEAYVGSDQTTSGFHPATGKKSPQTGDNGINLGSLSVTLGCGAAVLWYAGKEKKSRDSYIGR